jgi:hypothetical protein
MTRKTKAETLAVHKLAQEAILAEMTKTYPARLMLALEMAQRFDMEITIQNAQFIVSRPRTKERDWPLQFTLTHMLSRESVLDLEDLELEIQHQQAAMSEELRIQEVKRAALAKLTDEERKLLNL